MEVYIAKVQQNDWETEEETLGVYSDKEKAEKAVLKIINKYESTPFASIAEFDNYYDNEDCYEEPNWLGWVETWTVE